MLQTIPPCFSFMFRRCRKGGDRVCTVSKSQKKCWLNNAPKKKPVSARTNHCSASYTCRVPEGRRADRHLVQTLLSSIPRPARLAGAIPRCFATAPEFYLNTHTTVVAASAVSVRERERESRHILSALCQLPPTGSVEQSVAPTTLCPCFSFICLSPLFF